MAYEVIFDGMELPRNLIWSDRDDNQAVAQQVERTLSGNLVVFSGSLSSGKNITLTSSATTGWLTKLQSNAMQEKANVPGAIYTLVYGDFTTNVMFRNQEPPSFSAKPLLARTNHDDTDYYTCTIKLMEIK